MDDVQKEAKFVRITPRTITGGCSVRNKGALDWSYNGLLAYGCHRSVVVVDTEEPRTVQTLDRHRATVTCVRWPRLQQTGDRTVLLASACAAGIIVVWDVAAGVALRLLEDNAGSKTPPLLSWWAGDRPLILALHPPHSLLLWDATDGTKVWKKTYANQLLPAADQDPFDPSRMTMACPDGILVVEDVSPVALRPPSGAGRKLYISSTRSSTPATPTVSGHRLRKLVRDIIVGDAESEDAAGGGAGGGGVAGGGSGGTSAECLQVTFHRCLRHIVCLVYAREVLLVDLRIQHTVAVVTPTERTYAPLQQLLLCRQRDALFFVHESGSVSLRCRRGPPLSDADPWATSATPATSGTSPAGPSALVSPWNAPEADAELTYDHRCHTDSIRLTKNNRVLAAGLDPLTETGVALLLTDGRLYIYHLTSTSMTRGGWAPPLCQMLPPLWSSPASALTGAGLQLTLGALALPLAMTCNATGAVLSMCPPLTVKNWVEYEPLAAVGCSNGQVQLVDVATGLVARELAVHNYAVRGIEWTQLHQFLSYAQSDSGGLGGGGGGGGGVGGSGVGAGQPVHNELALTQVRTGRSVVVRPDRGDESAIEFVRVSPLKQYFIVVFRDAPPELWDLRHLTLIRTLPKRFPVVTALEWLPSQLQQRQRATKKSSSTSATSGEDSDSTLLKTSIKEFFVFADPDGNVYHLTVEGSVVKDGARLSPPQHLSGITAMAWKNDWMALGDAEGAVVLWEWRTRHYRPLPQHRSAIRKLRFAPGKNNLKLLVLTADGPDVWDVRDGERLGQWRQTSASTSTGPALAVCDADWSASDRPLLAMSDGSLRVFELTLQRCSSPSADYAAPPPMALLPQSALLAVRTGIQLRLTGNRLPATDQAALVDGFLSKAGLQPSLSFSEETTTSGLSKSEDEAEPEDEEAELEGDLAAQALEAAQRTGDAFQILFWQVASFYLNFYAAEKQGIAKVAEQRLDTSWDLLADAATYRRMAADRTALYASKPLAYDQTRQITRDQLLLGDKDRAIALLLNTEPAHDHFYSNHLLACLAAVLGPSADVNAGHSPTKLAAGASPGGGVNAGHSTIKLVATHLIAAGHVWHGVEILILNSQVADACRYLQAHQLWEDSARVAKLLLMETGPQHSGVASANEAAEIWQKWAHHLAVSGRKLLATLVLVSVGAWQRAAELLAGQQAVDAAALLVRQAQRRGLYDVGRDAEAQRLSHALYCQYARSLHQAGWPAAAHRWAARSGTTGARLIDEWRILDAEES